MVFRNDQHKATFEKEIQLHEGSGKEVTAAIYLLTADSRLWRQVERHVGAKSIDITAVKLAQRYDPGSVCREVFISNYDTSQVPSEQTTLSGFAPEERNFIWK